MKIFDYHNNDTNIAITLLNKEFNIEKKNLYSIIFNSWCNNGTSEELVFLLKLLYYNSIFWNKNYRKIWLIYISCLLERGDTLTAKKVLNRYIQLYQILDMEKILPVAAFALENNIISDKIKISAGLFNKLENIRKHQTFEKYIQNKSIAFVGNGSQILQSNKGNEIDSHDIVIRFNKYKINGYETDCGQKTDVWVTIDNYQEARNNINYIFFRQEYWNNFIDFNKISCIFNNCENIGVLSLKNLQFAKDCFGNDFYIPTTGCLTILAIYQILGNFKNVDFYGFNFLDNEIKPLDHYFANVSKRHQNKAEEMHNFTQESKFLKKFIKEHSGQNSYTT